MSNILNKPNNNETRNKDWPQESVEGKNMSEQQLADKLGKKRPYLNAISCGRKNVTIEQLERIAEGLGMTLHICFE